MALIMKQFLFIKFYKQKLIIKTVQVKKIKFYQLPIEYLKKFNNSKKIFKIIRMKAIIAKKINNFNN